MNIWTLDDTDETIDEVIALMRMSLSMAEEAEIMHPETISSLRAWCNSESRRLHPREYGPRFTPEQEIQAGLRRSKWWPFWESLEKNQEIRWTGTKNATYFVVDPKPSLYLPEDTHRRTAGSYIELRRHTGKTFWTHIGNVRPCES